MAEATVRGTLERRRKRNRLVAAFAVLAVGSLLGAGLVVLGQGSDGTPPSSRASIAEEVTGVPFDVTWEASDGSGSGVVLVELWRRIDGGPWSLLTASEDARGAFRYDPAVRARVDVYSTAVDRAGNREAAPETPDASVTFDPDAPSAALAPVAAYWHRGPVALVATASGNVTGVALRYHFAPDNATWRGPLPAGNATAPYGWTFVFPEGPGHYRLSARAHGPDGQREGDPGLLGAELAIGFDAMPPSGSVPPVDPYWRTEPLPVTATASDDLSGLARVDLVYAYRPNGTGTWSPWRVAGSRSAPPWSFVFAYPEGDGRYALAARSVDRAGWETPMPDPWNAVGLGVNGAPPEAPVALVPRWIDPASRAANVTWLGAAAPDIVAFEVHRGTAPDFAPTGCPGATCVASLGREARAAWVPLPTEGVPYWIRIVAVDHGGLTATSNAVAAVVHGPTFDTPSSPAQATSLPLGIAWSERLENGSQFVDYADAFRVSLGAGGVLSVMLGVPATGDFRVYVMDAQLRTVARGDTRGLGVWESLRYVAAAAGTYYVVVELDLGGLDDGNEGWYTLVASVG